MTTTTTPRPTAAQIRALTAAAAHADGFAPTTTHRTVVTNLIARGWATLVPAFDAPLAPSALQITDAGRAAIGAPVADDTDDDDADDDATAGEVETLFPHNVRPGMVLTNRPDGVDLRVMVVGVEGDPTAAIVRPIGSGNRMPRTVDMTLGTGYATVRVPAVSAPVNDDADVRAADALVADATRVAGEVATLAADVAAVAADAPADGLVCVYCGQSLRWENNVHGTPILVGTDEWGGVCADSPVIGHAVDADTLPVDDYSTPRVMVDHPGMRPAGEPDAPVAAAASVERRRAPSGNTAHDLYRATHTACGWSAPWVASVDAARRDAASHECTPDAPVVAADAPAAVTTGHRSTERTTFLADVLCAALEGGVGYWSAAGDIARVSETTGAQCTGDDWPWRYDAVTLWEVGDGDECHARDGGPCAGHRVTLDDIARAISRISKTRREDCPAAGGFAYRYVQAVRDASMENDAGDIDADIADIVAQVAALGSVIYG